MSPEEQLYELLKTAEPGVGKLVAQKADPTPPSTNEKAPELKGSETFYKLPEKAPDQQFTADIKADSDKDRSGELGELFGKALTDAEKADQQLVSHNLDHGKAHNFETHSVLLKPVSNKEKSAETLMRRVQKLTGRI